MAHGTTVNEVATGVRPPARVTARVPVYTSIAPINAGDVTFVNKPQVFYTLAEAEETLGPLLDSSVWDDWTLCEAVSAHFSVYGVGPIICINVIDPDNAAHVASATGETHLIGTDGTIALQTYGAPDEAVLGIIKSTVVIKKAGVTKTIDTDYTLTFQDDGSLLLEVVAGGTLAASDTITADFDYLDPSGVVAADIIGGYSAGAYTGLEVIEQVYQTTKLVPGLLLAPKWSQTPTVAARLAVLAGSINGSFRAHAVVDLSSDPAVIPSYASAAAWKTANSFDVDDMTCCWGKISNDGDVYHLSTLLACLCQTVDNARNGLPYASPSNQALTGATAMVLNDGTEVLLTRTQANALNAQGIVTAINGFYGWRLWGNRTAVYPATTDPKDAFIPIRHMFNWIGSTIILTTDRDVDQPGNRRLIDSVLGTIGSFLNGLVAAGALVDGSIEFRSDENPVADLADGIIRWHLILTPPSPAESIEFTLEYDPTALAALFA